VAGTSTVAALLKRNGLSKAPTAAAGGHPGRLPGNRRRPMSLGMDFKGQFGPGTAVLLPFTVTTLPGRYLLCCDGYLSIRGEEVRTSLERVFRQHGMPGRLQPTTGAVCLDGIARRRGWGSGGLARDHEQLIEPARPAQNGKHERMHRTLKKATTRRRPANLHRQQELFASFQREFTKNGLTRAWDETTCEVYRPSPRQPRDAPPIEYPGHYEVRRVSRNRWG